MTLPNIGLIGKLRSGKDTAAAYLAHKYGYMRFAFGNELKRYAHELFGEPLPGTKPRELYQWFGQAMRERDPEIWVRKCFERVEYVQEEYGISTVITDCRQPNEFSALQSAGYVLIRVEAPESLRIQRAVESGDSFALRDLTHGTETALDGYIADFTVQNDAGLPELHAQVDDIMRYLAIGDGRAA